MARAPNHSWHVGWFLQVELMSREKSKSFDEAKQRTEAAELEAWKRVFEARQKLDSVEAQVGGFAVELCASRNRGGRGAFDPFRVLSRPRQKWMLHRRLSLKLKPIINRHSQTLWRCKWSTLVEHKRSTSQVHVVVVTTQRSNRNREDDGASCLKPCV